MAYANGGAVMSGGGGFPPDLGNQYNPSTMGTAQRNNVGDELAGHEKRLEALHEILGQLEQRLSPVLRATAPDAQGLGSPIASASAVVESLRRSGHKLDAAYARLQGLIDRLEL